MTEFSDTIDWGLRLVLLVATPSAVGLAVLAVPVLATLFYYGEFGPHDVNMASASLIAFSFGLPAFVLIKILASGFFARQDTRTPVRVGVVAMLSNIVFNLMLVVPLKHAGLALATSLSAFINAGLLLRGLRRDHIFAPRPGWLGFAARLMVANLMMGIFLVLLRGEIGAWLEWSPVDRALHLVALIVGGTLVYALTLRLSGLRTSSLSRPDGT